MSAGTMDDTGPAEPRMVNAARLVQSLCDEFGAGVVAGLAAGLEGPDAPQPPAS